MKTLSKFFTLSHTIVLSALKIYKGIKPKLNMEE